MQRHGTVRVGVSQHDSTPARRLFTTPEWMTELARVTAHVIYGDAKRALVSLPGDWICFVVTITVQYAQQGL